MDKLLIEQNSLQRNIENFIINTNKTGKDKHTDGFIQARISLLNNYWAKFQGVHKNLLLQATAAQLEEENYFVEDVYSSVELTYSDNLGQLTESRRKFSISKAPSTAAPDATTSTQGTANFTTSLPKNQLPRFSGELREWPAFHDLFSSLVHSNQGLTGSQKLFYLKTSLYGPAEQLIRNTPVTDANFESAWEILCTRYQNERLLVNANLKLLTSLPAMKTESADELRKLHDGTVETIKALECLNRPVEHWDDWLVFMTVQKLDIVTRKDWEASLTNNDSLPTFDLLNQFLRQRITTLEAMRGYCSKSVETKTSPPKPFNKAAPVKAHHTSTATKCPACTGGHWLLFCPNFRQKTVSQRREFVSANKLCFNCLRAGHQQSSCPSHNRCKHCSQLHHSMLHPIESVTATIPPPVSDKPQPLAAASSSVKGQQLALPSTSASARGHQLTALQAYPSARHPKSILLATARVIVRAANGQNMEVRALLDQGSQVTFVSSAVAKLLRLPRNEVNVPISGIGLSDGGTVRSTVTLTLQSAILPNFVITTEALVLPKLTVITAIPKIEFSDCNHLSGLQLADPNFFDKGQVDLIIGADNYHSLLLNGLRKGTPTAQETTLGWVLSGPIPSAKVYAHTCNRHEDPQQLDCLIQRFWEVEDVIPSKSNLTAEEEYCEEFYKTTTTRDNSGRYTVRLPMLKQYKDSIHFGDSATIAEKTLLRMERRFNVQPIFKDRYIGFMKDYLALRHMEPVEINGTQSSTTYYFPHHGVMKENSCSTKLRVVFNGSQKSTNGFSLNDYLSTGPKLQTELRSIILRWRTHPIVFAADLKMMFRQILIHQDDLDLQRILWRETPADDITTYRLRTVTYGTKSAPYLAIRTLQQLAEDEQSAFPKGAEILLRDFYVDDVLSGAADLDEALNLQKELVQLLKRGGFELHKWSANDPQLLLIAAHETSSSSLSLDKDGTVKTLGLHWRPDKDHFEFQVTLLDSPKIVTKRNLLSDVARLYDPLGFLTPATLMAKGMFQKLWLLKLDWDTALPDTLAEEWLSFRSELINLENISVPRWIGCHDAKLAYELHGFSDASETAYSAVIYLRVLHDYSNTQISLLTSKTKLAPIKPLSIPRLELCGAGLLARLLHNVLSTIDLPDTPLYCWTDSQTVLTWLKAHPSRWKTFIANRVSTIHDLIPHARWRHVPGSSNPADCASRGIRPSKLATHKIWWEGPPWLTCHSTSWPDNVCSNDPSAKLEERSSTASVAIRPDAPTTPTPWKLISKYSSLQRLLRVTAYIQRFISKLLTTQQQSSVGPPTASEVTSALFWIRECQKCDFPDEYQSLSKGQRVKSNSRILLLDPFFDETTSSIRVGGRLQQSLLHQDAKHQFITGRNSPLVPLIIRQAHEKTLHGGIQLTSGEIRQSFWIVNGRDAVRRFLRGCVICARERKEAISPQQLGQLPASRIRPTRPFNQTGLDYAGPVHVRYGPGRGRASHKAFIAIFICMATKAVHIELVSDLTTAAFIAAYKRFSARHGISRKIYSDNGSTFVGADSELKQSFIFQRAELPDELASLLASNGTDWEFIPPRAPNFGGLWEAGVKSAKHHLRRVIGKATLTFEELTTLLTQVEACLNSRPLYPASPDPNNLEALTPGHFLIGSPLLTPPEPSLITTPMNRLSRWKLLQQMYEHFWRRWSIDYLNNLQVRYKWKTPSRNIAPGSLALLRDDNTPPSQWLLGRVLAVHPGPDGLVRVVTLRCKNSTLKRPASKVCILPVPSSDEGDNSSITAGSQPPAPTAGSVSATMRFRPEDEAGSDVRN